MFDHKYFTYILTNYKKTVLYVGVTNSLERRLTEHFSNRGNNDSFTGKYSCFYLLYYESFKYINDAIAREKEIKGWSRKKKENLINEENQSWEFLNTKIMTWPPTEGDSLSSFRFFGASASE
jgi:putative endonuclease